MKRCFLKINLLPTNKHYILQLYDSHQMRLLPRKVAKADQTVMLHKIHINCRSVGYSSKQDTVRYTILILHIR